jgi:hypothetical protein
MAQLGGAPADMKGVTETFTGKSRAVLRVVDPGNSASCAHCGSQVKFQARAGLRQVIANVYQDGSWARVEHYHADCYAEAGHPHGPTSD